MTTNGSRAVQVMDAQAIQRALVRIAHEIVERNKSLQHLALVGIRSRGVHIAERIHRSLKGIEAGAEGVPFGVVDITLYRDDLDRRRHGSGAHHRGRGPALCASAIVRLLHLVLALVRVCTVRGVVSGRGHDTRRSYLDLLCHGALGTTRSARKPAAF